MSVRLPLILGFSLTFYKKATPDNFARVWLGCPLVLVCVDAANQVYGLR
jgi:hypothetical protein